MQFPVDDGPALERWLRQKEKAGWAIPYRTPPPLRDDVEVHE